MSVTGPQNWLTQKTGVEKITSAGIPSRRARAMVEPWSSGSGMACPPWARESTASGGWPEPRVGFRLATASSPGAG
jgi:hypothetical protein